MYPKQTIYLFLPFFSSFLIIFYFNILLFFSNLFGVDLKIAVRFLLFHVWYLVIYFLDGGF